MTNLELFQAVKSRKEKIEDLFDPTTFVLNPEIVKLEQEIHELQSQCQHDFTDSNECKICGIVKHK